MTADRRNDLLAGPADNLVSVQYVLAALRRKRRVLAGLAAVGLCIGALLTFALPKSRSASTSLLLQFPAGTDPTRAMSTDVSLLQTRAVAQATVKELGLHEAVEKFQGSYRSEVLSDAVLRITVKGSSAAQAVERSAALSRAFLDFRKQVYDGQLAVVNAVLLKQEATLKAQVATADDKIASFNPAKAGSNDTTLADLLSQRSAETDNIAQLDAEIQSNTIATATVVSGSRVIDPGNPIPVSMKRTLVMNAASGLVAGFAIAAGAITLLAVTTTRLRRRADVAAALKAPVLLSVGPVLPPRWVRTVAARVHRHADRARRAPTLHRLTAPSDDLKLVVRHLQSVMTSAATQPPALVVVSINNVDLAAVTVRALAERLSAEGEDIVVVNEAGRPLPTSARPVPPATAAASTDGASTNGGSTNGESTKAVEPANGGSESEVVVVVAVLDPAKGAEHLREWATDVVVLVTAGRSTATTLESNATMIRAAGLQLRSVVLVGCDRDDDSLGAYDTGPVAPVKSRTARAPRKATKARST